jgi:FKBP-type peptidyl-prolyl cis-trans isomerase 2
MTESRTRSKPAATDTTSKPAATKASPPKANSTKAVEAKKVVSNVVVAAPAKAKGVAANKPAGAAKTAVTKKSAATGKTAVVKKSASENVAAVVKKPASAKKAAGETVAAEPAASGAKKTPASKSTTASKSTAVNETPAASTTPVADKKPARKSVVAQVVAAPKAAARGKKPLADNKVVEAVNTPVTEAKKRKASAPAKARSTKIAAETVAEAPAEKTSIQGADISFSAVQEPPQHLTLRVDVNRVVAFHYRLREIRPDGSASLWIEESFGRQPLFYLHGRGNVIAGLEQAMAGRKAGDAINITLPPELAYGLRTSNDLMRLPIKHLHGNVNPKALVPGSIVTMKTNQGLKNALVMKVGKFNVDVDTNHPYAGRTLHYQIEILGVRPATAEEVAHRHVHGPGGHQH